MRVGLFLFPAGNEIEDKALELGLDLRPTELLRLALGHAATLNQAVEEAIDRDVDAAGHESAPPPFARSAQAHRVGAGGRPLDRGCHGFGLIWFESPVTAGWSGVDLAAPGACAIAEAAIIKRARFSSENASMRHYSTDATLSWI